MKNPVHVQHWGTHISTPVVSPEKAQVQVEIQLANKQSDWSGSYQIKTSLMDVDGQEVASAASDFEFSAGAGSLIQQLAVKRPRLWGFETPHLYQAVSSISRDGKVLDTYTTSFGIRTIAFTREGFFLNGKREKIKGVCLHHDLGPLGAAVNDRATARQLEIMKAMGVNAIRTAHNPTSPEQLALCDKMGILVQAEAFDCWELPKTENDYHKYWAAWHEQDLRDMIRRDRNHPAIIMWSIGNEVGEQRTDNGRFIAQKLVQICKEEDPYRPTTAGFNHLTAALKNGLADEVDLIGANYKPTQYEEVRARNPEWIVYGSETASCVSSRGVYHLPLAKYNKHESLQISSYDIQSPPWAYPPDVEFHFQDSLPGMIGEFVWTGFDYLGEPTPYGGKDNLTHGNWDVDWPSRSSYFGIVDLAGFPKDRFYLYQSQWTTAPMVHLLPHWNWEGKGVTEIPVYCYTNCEEAELFVNGKSQGRKKMGVDKTRIPVAFGAWGKRPRYFDSPYRLHWNVSYEPGEIEVLAYRGGKVVAQTSIKTAKEPANILLTADREIIQANGEDLSFITVKIMDENSIFCPLANNKIDFTLEGPATIAAVGNGNAASTAPFQAPFRNAFNGLCLLVIRSEKGKTGEVKIHASSPGLAPQSITIMTK
jgi:beta-galactosidase